jgi:hypothetical protein
MIKVSMSLICYNCGMEYNTIEDNVMAGSLCRCRGGYLFEVDVETEDDVILEEIEGIE